MFKNQACWITFKKNGGKSYSHCNYYTRNGRLDGKTDVTDSVFACQKTIREIEWKETGENSIPKRRHSSQDSNELMSCSYCKALFKRIEELESHIREHLTMQPFACDICSKRFTTQSSLTQHRYMQHFSDVFECSVCKKEIRKKQNYQVHMNSHLNVFPFVCYKCGKGFNCKYILIKHETKSLCHGSTSNRRFIKQE